jgi:hypothetical protein
MPRFELELESELAALESQFGITVEREIVHRAGFDGRAESLVLVKFVIAGMASGVLRKVGETAWGRLTAAIRRILGQNDRKTAYKAEVEITVGDNETYARFVCSTTRAEEVDGLRAFRTALQSELLTNASLKGFSKVRYKLAESGSWTAAEAGGRDQK